MRLQKKKIVKGSGGGGGARVAAGPVCMPVARMPCAARFGTVLCCAPSQSEGRALEGLAAAACWCSFPCWRRNVHPILWRQAPPTATDGGDKPVAVATNHNRLVMYDTAALALASPRTAMVCFSARVPFSKCPMICRWRGSPQCRIRACGRSAVHFGTSSRCLHI